MTTYPEANDFPVESQAWKRAIQDELSDLRSALGLLARNGAEVSRGYSESIRSLAAQLSQTQQAIEESTASGTAPVTIVVTPYAYFDVRGIARGAARVEWGSLGEEVDDIDGTPAQYEVWLRAVRAASAEPEDDGQAVPPAPEEDSQRITTKPQTYAELLDLDLGKQYAVKIRPISAGGTPGDFSEEQVFTTPGGPNDVLAAPNFTVRSERGNVIVSWDGRLGGQAPPAHFRHVATQRANSSTGPWTAVGQTLSRAGESVWPEDIGSNVWVRVIAYDSLKRPGTPSNPASVLVLGIELPDVGGTITDAIEEALDAANHAQSTADGKITISPNAPTLANGSGKPTGALWWRHNGTNVIGMWEWSGTAWVIRQVDNAAIANLDAGKITAGFLDAARIAAASIVTSKLLVGNFTNLVDDPTFERPIGEAWTPSTGGTWSVADVGGSWRRTARVTVTGTWTTLQGPRITVDPGDEFFVRAGIYDPLAGSGGSARVVVYFRDADGNDLAAQSVAQDQASTWSTKTLTATAPAGAKTAQFMFNVQGRTSGTVNFGLPAFMRRANANLIVDGAITTVKLDALAVTAAKIAANAITAAKIAAGAIQAAHLAVGVGLTGTRMELVGTGLTLFDDDDDPIVALTTAMDNLLTINRRNDVGNAIPVAYINEMGNAGFQALDITDDIYMQNVGIVGDFGTDTVNGEDLGSLPLLDRFGRGIIASASIGTTSYGNVAHSYAALAIGSVNLLASRIYQVRVVGPTAQAWTTNGGAGNLYIQCFVGTGTQGVTASNTTNGTYSSCIVLRSGAATGTGAQEMFTFAPFSPNIDSDYNIMIRLYNESDRSWSFNPGLVGTNPTRVEIVDIGPAAMTWDAGNWATRATSGTVTPPAPSRKTQTWSATWSVLWGPSGSIRPSGSSLYDDGRMLQGGNTSLGSGRSARVGFPALGLSGRTIKGAWLRVKVRHTGTSGAVARIGTHGNASAPSGSSPDSVNTFSRSLAKGQTQWLEIPSSLWSGIASGSIRGFQIGGPNVNTGKSDYVILDGYSLTNAATSSGVRPQLKVTYQ